MAALGEQNAKGSDVDFALNAIAIRAGSDAMLGYTFAATYIFDLRDTFGFRSFDVSVGGTGFTRDAGGRLTGGTISSIQTTVRYAANATVVVNGETYSGLSLPVAHAIELAGIPSGAAPQLLAGDDTIIANAPAVFGYDGNDVITITGVGTLAGSTATAVDGGMGVDTAIFPFVLRSAANITGGGGNETVVQSGFTSNLVSIDKLQFIDGSVYEDNATAGAQAALIFEGIFGRLPDGINAGGFGALAEQQSTPAAARAMLTTPEAQANAANLGNADFVARLYRTMLHREPDAAGAAAWQGNLDRGDLDRGTVAASFASSVEAQQANFAAFASGSVFAADPLAVEVLRAYKFLLNRAPETSALIGNMDNLRNGPFAYSRPFALMSLYGQVIGSPEFRSQQNLYGVTSYTGYAALRSIATSDQVTALITPLVTSQGVTVHA